VRHRYVAALPSEELCDWPDNLGELFGEERIGFRASDRGCVVELPLEEGEHLFGFGLQMRTIDATGKRLWMRVSDRPDTELGDSHAPVPFYVSTRGYGVLIDTARYATFYLGGLGRLDDRGAVSEPADRAGATSTDELYASRGPAGRRVVVDVPTAQGVDVYLFAGPSLIEAVRRYNLFSGGGCLPPIWGLAMAYRGLNVFGAKETLKVARYLREHDIPCDCWGLEPGWQTRSYSCSFVWHPERFPDPDAFLAEMSQMGYRVNLWEHAFTHPESPLYGPLKPLSGDHRVWQGLVPDLSLPEARRLFAEYHAKEVARPGVASFKLDECDNQTRTQPWSFPELSRFPSGMDGEQMHSLLGPLYQQALLDVYKPSGQRTYGLVRAGHAMAAPLPYVLYSDVYDHRDYVRALMTAGFSGLLWTPEVRDCKSVEELYRRVQTVVFSPLANINAWYLKNPPWLQIDRKRNNADDLMPERDEVEAVIRRLFELRMSLVPYLYSAFAEYRFLGLPPFRHPVMDHPEDPNTYGLEDEFMVGRDLLVAPLFAGEHERKVYLPEGGWYEFHTNQHYEGKQTITVTAGPERIPFFVRAGAILPLAEPVTHITRDTVFRLTCRVYGPGTHFARLFEDDGETDAYERGEYGWVRLDWSQHEGGSASREGHAPMRRYEVVGYELIDAR
jgi:alpha-D-xyloside xylohydrolase